MASRVEEVLQSVMAGPGGAAQNAESGSTKDQAAPASPAKRQSPRHSGFDKRPGRRPMKEYPLTEGELNELAGIGMLATVCFSLAAALFGFAVDVSKDIAFSTALPATVATFWGALRGGAMVLAVILALVGGAFVLRGRSRLNAIKRETDHGNG